MSAVAQLLKICARRYTKRQNTRDQHSPDTIIPCLPLEIISEAAAVTALAEHFDFEAEDKTI